MILAIILGIVAGLIGFTPLYLGQRHAEKMSKQSSALGYVGAALFPVLISFALLAAAMFVCAFVARAVLLPFALAEVAVLVIAAVALGIRRIVQRR